jgi:hypothetical protein
MPPELISELVEEVKRYKNVSLGEREAEFLAKIGEGHNSSYRIFSHLKKIGQPMDYKNVNKRVRRLQELGLIAEIKSKGESIHNAKFFDLTSEGIFYLLTQYHPASWNWIIKYKNNLIVKVLLYPYFDENTVRPFVMILEIGRYLRECFHIIQLAIDFIKNNPRGRSLKETVLKQLQSDLEWQAKALAFRLITKRNTFLYEPMAPSRSIPTGYNIPPGHNIPPGSYLTVESPNKKGVQNPIGYSFNLLKDKKFIELSKNIGKEYEEAFSRLVKATQKSE